MSNTTRSAARTRGLKLAAKVATVGGIAVAALGLVEARAASASSGSSATATLTRDVTTDVANDDAKPLPLEDVAKTSQVRGGNCGCAPCWGPPAPPARGAA